MRKAGPRLLACAAIVLAAGTSFDAQWIKLPTPGLPRLADGKPDPFNFLLPFLSARPSENASEPDVAFVTRNFVDPIVCAP